MQEEFTHSTDHRDFTVFHQGEDEDTLEAIIVYLEQARMEAGDFFQESPQKTNLYIFQNQKDLQVIRGGFLVRLMPLHWYIGDNLGVNALIVSPNTPVKGHSFQTIMEAIPHEFIHTMVHRLYPQCPLWLNEGVAIYLTNAMHEENLYENYPLTDLKTLESDSHLRFAARNGYVYADKFIEYILEAYSRETLFKLMEGRTYEEALGSPLEEVYKHWAEYISRRY